MISMNVNVIQLPYQIWWHEQKQHNGIPVRSIYVDK